jgi:hypothetical protein
MGMSDLTLEQIESDLINGSLESADMTTLKRYLNAAHKISTEVNSVEANQKRVERVLEQLRFLVLLKEGSEHHQKNLAVTTQLSIVADRNEAERHKKTQHVAWCAVGVAFLGIIVTVMLSLSHPHKTSPAQSLYPLTNTMRSITPQSALTNAPSANSVSVTNPSPPITQPMNIPPLRTGLPSQTNKPTQP